MKPKLKLTGFESAKEIKNKVDKILNLEKKNLFNNFCQYVDWNKKDLAVAQVLTLAKNYVEIE